jgi:phenylpropionate dioxygenase-like ring-hydroxylating dioxygenase large terminal subunit
MIRNQWYIILESRQVGSKRPMGVTRMGEKLVLWRDSQGKVYCMGDRCPHMNAPLHKGKINIDHLACPFHGFEYDNSGQCRYLPASGIAETPPKVLKAKSYPTHEAHGFIWIWWGDDPPADLQPPRWFESIDGDFTYGTVQDPWSVHYSRSAENQLDMSHLPFVHHNTIGRGGRKVVDGPVVQMDGDRINVWVFNRLDDGTPRRDASELDITGRHPSLQFQFPNYWHNWISDDVRVMAAFVPVDEENTILYLRFYQRFVRLPVMRDLVNFVGRRSNIVIAHQDRRIVTGQIPKRTFYKMKERLRPSDGAIYAYRKHRRYLKRQAGQVEEEIWE